MKQAMIDFMHRGINDELYTPNEAIYPLLPYLPSGKTYYEPCSPPSGISNITEQLKDNGLSCKTEDVGVDFLLRERVYQDIIITNPPYSLKTAFLAKCFELDKPFAMLLPITALEGVQRGKLFRKHGIQLLVLDKRINYMKAQGKKSCWFNTSWFCWKLLPKDLMFAEVPESA